MKTASMSASLTIFPRAMTTWPVTKLRVTDSTLADASWRICSVAASLYRLLGTTRLRTRSETRAICVSGSDRLT
jgi:hypothetical protein